MESADDSDFSGSDEDVNQSKTVTVSIVVPRTTTSDEVVENGKEKSHDATKNMQQVTPPGLKESPKQEKKRLRLKDDLAISPDQTKIGKRQRKVNSLYSGYAIDKKTTQFFSQNASPTITDATANAAQANKREIIMSPAEAQKRQKNLPKGYAYEPIFIPNQSNNNTPPSSETPSSSKRERKKKKENPEFVDPTSPGQEDSGEVTTTTTNIETPASKTRSKRSRGSATSTPLSNNVESISNQVQTITVHPIVERKLDEDEDVIVEEEEEDDDYLSESEEEFEEGTKKKRGYYRTKKQTLQMQLQELQSKLDLVTQNLAAAQNAAGSQTQNSSASNSTQKQNSKRRGAPVGAGRKKKKEKDSFLDSDYEEDYDSEDSYSKKSRKKTSPSIRGGTHNNTSTSTSGSGGRGRRKKEDVGIDVNKELAQCKRIVQALMKNTSAYPFNQPVDPVALGIMDYFDIIKNPMDLKTILENLNAGEYLNADDFASDVRLVWRNAITYNGSNHTVSKMAQALSQIFEKKFLKVRPYGAINNSTSTTTRTSDFTSSSIASSTSSTSSSTSSIKQHMQSTISELRDSMIQMREEIQALRKEKAAAATAAKQMARQSAPAIPKQRGPGRPKTKNKPTPIHKSVTREDARPMSFEEKRILSENINLLDAEALGKVVQLIHQRMPNLAQNGNDEIEIDIDAMDAATLRHLEKFVKNSLSKLRKKGSSAPPTKIQAAELVSQNTSKSIQDVKQRLQELSTRSTALKKKKIEEEGNEDVVIDDLQDENKHYPSVEIDRDPDSSSSSDSSSDSDSSSSSSSSSSDSDSSGPDKKKKKKEKHFNSSNADSSIPPSITVTIDKAPIPEQKDNISLSPVRTEPITATTTTTTTTSTTESSPIPPPIKKEEAPQILHPTAVSKEVELKNVDAWKFDLDAWDTQTVSSTTSPSSQTKDETWSQFQNRDLQNQLREKEREERERKEKEERELERKKQEEQRQREIAEAEENKKRAEQEENERKQKEIEAKREAARKAREEMSSQRSVMDQSIMMQSFEMNHDTSDKPALLDVFKLKQDDLGSDRAPPREEGEV